MLSTLSKILPAKAYSFILIATITLVSANARDASSNDSLTKNSFTLSNLNVQSAPAILHWKFFPYSGNNIQALKNVKAITLESNFLLDENGKSPFIGTGWFSTTFKIDKNLKDEKLCLKMAHLGASEIYLDGVLVKKIGVIKQKSESDINYNAGDMPFSIVAKPGIHSIQVRYSNKNIQNHFEYYNVIDPGFELKIALDRFAYESFYFANLYFTLFIFGLALFFFSTSFIHFLLFIFYRKQISNLHYAIYSVLLGCVFVLAACQNNSTNPNFSLWSGRMVYYLLPLSFLMLMWMLLHLFSTNKASFLRRSLIILLLIFLLRLIANKIAGFLIFGYIVSCVITSMVFVIKAIRQKSEGAWIIGFGAMLFLILIGIILLGNMFGQINHINLSLNSVWSVILIIMITIAIVSIPISMSIYLAKGFSTANLHLEAQLIQVEKLSALTIQQEKEKQKMLESQKENLEIQVKERTREVEEQKAILEEQNKNIIDSINYAKRIQQSVLPNETMISKIFKRLKK